MLANQGHAIKIHKETIMYGSEDLPLTDTDYDIWAKGPWDPLRLNMDKDTWDTYIGDVGYITVEVRLGIFFTLLTLYLTSLKSGFALITYV